MRKATVEESCDLTIQHLKRRGMLTGAQAFDKITWTSSMTGKSTSVLLAVCVTDDPHVRLVYTIADRRGETDYNHGVSLVTTPCNFGGVRYWFACPSCGRRVGVLYLAPGDVHFRCRHCNDLSYWSRNCSGMESLGETGRQIDKLRSEIKRWTWRGLPTRKVRRLQAFQRKMGILSGPITARVERLAARTSRR